VPAWRAEKNCPEAIGQKIFGIQVNIGVFAMSWLGKNIFLALCLLCSAQAMGALFGKEPPKPLVLQAATNREEAFMQLVDDGAALRRAPKPYAGPVKPVAISSVALEFITDTGAASNRGDLRTGEKLTQTVNYKLAGVTPETMQGIADDFAAHFRKALTDQGYTVLEQEKLLADPSFKAAVAEAEAPQTKSNFLRKNGSVMVVSRGMADTSGLLAGMKDVSLSKALGDTLVVSVHILVNFAQFEDTGVYREASVTHRVQLSIATQSKMSVVTETGLIPYPFLRTTVLPSQISANVASVAASGGQSAAGLLGALAGRSTRISNFEVTAVDNYREVASADLRMVAEVLAHALKKQ
jgi:hypothetical protein